MIEKYCKYCKQTKPIKGFTPNKRMTEGYNNKCKTCSNAYSLFRLKCNPTIYKENTVEWEVYTYFTLMRVHLPPEEVKSLVTELKMDLKNFFHILDAWELKYNVGPDSYVSFEKI